MITNSYAGGVGKGMRSFDVRIPAYPVVYCLVGKGNTHGGWQAVVGYPQLRWAEE